MAPVPIVNDDNASIKSSKSRHLNGASDSEAHSLVIASLRSQVNDLYSQVTQLNNKLVKSYDRVSDLEDDLHVASANLRSSSLRISQLELERTQHLSALNTGLLVEKSQVTAELTRLMEKATEEAAQRGQAESARADIEKDLDDLSASLFHQANTMVAEARYQRSLSEQKVITAEQALKGAEEAIAIMQQQMQDLQAEKEASETKMQEMQITMGKGKWSARQSTGHPAPSIRLLCSHTPYQEFLLFVAHLRSVHPAAPQQPPAMTTLLPIPFISRLMTEDSEPTLRLDLAPSLNWLSRRSVLAAIHSGQLTIEPIPSAMLLQESQSSSSPGNNTVSCALCGAPIFPSLHTPLSQTRINLPLQNTSTTWSTSLFKRQLNGSATNSPPPSPGHPPRSGKIGTDNLPTQVHIFRVSPSTSNTNALPSVSVTIPSLPIALSYSVSSTSSLPPQPPQHPTAPHHTSTPSQSSSSAIYPLCTSGWCLPRLRATCSLWAFVRSGIVEKVWEEEVSNVPSAETASSGITIKSEKVAPPTPPPRRRGLWGMATALQERAANWSEGDKDKDKNKKEKEKEKKVAVPPPTPPKQPQTTEKRLPAAVPATPPPVHPVISSLNVNNASSISTPGSLSSSPTTTTAAAPPPLPKRNEGRARGNRQSLVMDKPSEESEPTVLFAVPHSPTAATLPAGPTPDDTTTTTNEEGPSASIKADDTQPSPARIPLPESRPGTPSTPVVASSGLNAPPPLPARAVARGPRPMRPRPGSRPVTPTPTAAANNNANGNTEEEGEGKKTEMETEKEKEETETRMEGGGDGGKPDKVTSETETVQEASVTIEERATTMATAEEVDASSSTAHASPLASASAGDEQERDTDASAASSGGSGTAGEDTNPNMGTEKHGPSRVPISEVVDVNGVGTTASEDGGSADPPVHGENEQSKTQTTTTSTQAAEEVEGKEKDTVDTSKETETLQVEQKKEKESEKQEDTGADTVKTEKIEDKGKDDVVYIGDSTWEERTWKEVVRLKEDMFWARIGGLRD